MKRLLSLCAVLLCAAAVRAANSPGANQGGGEGAGGGACWKDAQTLCPGIERGSGGIAPCLKQHMDAVSEACKASHPDWAVAQSTVAPAAARDPRDDWREACGKAFETNCGTLNISRVPVCMAELPKGAQKDLTPACKDQIKRFSPPKKKPTIHPKPKKK